MARVLLIQPWNYHDEGVVEHDLSQEWRNGPYSLVLLATILRNHDHEVRLVDLMRDMVASRGDFSQCLFILSQSIKEFRPDIIGFGFFSVHYLEVQKAVKYARKTCREIGITPIFIAGGIHASTEPVKTIKDLDFDYSFIGEADIGILDIAEGKTLNLIPGVCGKNTISLEKGIQTEVLDDLPFPDWSFCDYKFYSFPSFSKIKFKAVRTLDLMMGRGCVYKCAFCAYPALSSVRFYSAGYLVNQICQMAKDYHIDSVYFIDSTIGNNRRLLIEFCELMLQQKLEEKVEWYANMRPNQVNEELLKLMWRAGCRFLFYGFESGSQSVLDSMNKGMDVRYNYFTAELHKKLKFPYHASIILGYPGETEEDIGKTFEFVRAIQPPIMGVNWYVPLPGSPDYDLLREKGIITIDSPFEWRRIGEVNNAHVYADVEEVKFRELFAEMERFAYNDVPKLRQSIW
ncbi:MAG: B12-binding domain-containing radical SAM protein [Bacteroidetes bacterium]|nr:B12-binding domain-containing radical SAM protein [Bacteroidota bacterium]